MGYFLSSLLRTHTRSLALKKMWSLEYYCNMTGGFGGIYICHNPASNLFENIVEFPERSKPAHFRHILSHLSLSGHQIGVCPYLLRLK